MWITKCIIILLIGKNGVSLHYQTHKQKLHKIMTASNNSKMQLAVQMVIMDAIEKGHTNSNELIDYMQSDVFATAAKSYFEMLNQI